MDGLAVAARIREGLARRRMSRQQLAAEAKISLSTLEKALSGDRPFTLATIIRLETALQISLRENGAAKPSAQASVELGAYRREGVEWLAGTYLTLRPSFERPDAIYAYLTEIAWDDPGGHLVFRETARIDSSFAQKGVVSMPYQSGQIYLVTNHQGQYRLATLSRPSITGHMYGLLSTLQSDLGGRLIPIATPLALLRQGDGARDGLVLGQVAEGQPAYAGYRAEIDRIFAEKFSRIVG